MRIKEQGWKMQRIQSPKAYTGIGLAEIVQAVKIGFASGLFVVFAFMAVSL